MPNLPAPLRQAIAAIDRMGRRDFLKGTACAIGGGAFIGLVGTGGAQAKATMPEGLRFMVPAGYAVFHRLMEVSLPVAGTTLAPLSEIPVMQTLDAALLGSMSAAERDGLALGLDMFENGPNAVYGKPFTQLSTQEAEQFCDQWASSDDAGQRGLVTALKKLVALSYWANPPSWAALGYDGPVSEKWKLKSIGNAPMPAE